MKREDVKKALGDNATDSMIQAIMDLHQTDVTEHKAQLTKKDEEITTINQKVNEFTTKLKAFEGVDVEEMKKQLTGWETKYNDDLAAEKKNAAIKLAVATSKPKNEKMLMALIDQSIIKLNDDGSVTGFKEQLETISKENSFLFETEVKDVNLGDVGSSGAKGNEEKTTLESAIGAFYTQ